MPYFINLYGKSINKSGKLLFDYPEEVEEYTKRLIADCLPVLLSKYDKKKSLHRIRRSYKIIWIEDNSPLRDLFQASVIEDVEIILPQKYKKKEIVDGAPRAESSTESKPTAETNGAMEGADKGGNTNAKGRNQREYYTIGRLKNVDLGEHSKVKR